MKEQQQETSKDEGLARKRHLIFTALPLLGYPAAFVAGAMSLAGETGDEASYLLVLSAAGFLTLSLLYPLAYMAAILTFIFSKKIHTRQNIIWFLYRYLLCTLGLFALWAFTVFVLV